VTVRVNGVGRAGRGASGAGLSTGFSNGVNFSTGASFSGTRLSNEDDLSIGASFSGTSLSYDDDLSTSGGVTLSRPPPSNRAASDAVLRGRTVPCVDDETLRVGDGMFRMGDVGASAVFVVPRVFSHDGGFCEALLVVDCRKLTCEGVVGVSFGFKGELFGVKGRTVDGEASRMDPGLRKGDWRGLLKERGEGLYGVGVVDYAMLAATRNTSSGIDTPWS
jgi:hypothetical protein